MTDNIQFLYFLMHFLSNHERSGDLFVGSAISITHFAQVCAQRAWRGILVLDHPPIASENRRYVHSAIPNALLDNILDRLLLYFHNVMNLLILGDAPYEKSSKLANEMIIQDIKVSQTPISSSLDPLNRDTLIRRTKMRIDDIMDLVKFVDATATEDQKESFESQLLRWKNTKTKVTMPIGSAMVRSPFILNVAWVKSCSPDISISGAFWGTAFTPRQHWDIRSCKTRCTFLRTRGSFHRQWKETQENYHNWPHGYRSWRGCALWVYRELYSNKICSYQPPTRSSWLSGEQMRDAMLNVQ